MSRSRFWLKKGSVERTEKGGNVGPQELGKLPPEGASPLGRRVALERKLLLCPEAEGAPRKASLGRLGQPEAQPLFFLERGLEPPVQRFRNAPLLGWLVLCATGVTTHFNVQAPPGNSLREVLPRYEAAKRWVSYYCVQGRLSPLPRVWMRSTAASSGLLSRACSSATAVGALSTTP